jgi:hypothetical protein
LLIFVLENARSADVAFLVALPGSARVLHLRVRQRRQAGLQLPSAGRVHLSQIRDSLDSHHSAS